MKKLILVTCFFSATLLGDSIDSTQYKFTIYPELVGLGGLLSMNLEYTLGDYTVRAGIGMLDRETQLYPLAIYKVIGKGRNRAELGTGLFIGDGGKNNLGLGLVGALHWRKESRNGQKFRRIGINIGMLTMGWPLIIPTLGWGIKF